MGRNEAETRAELIDPAIQAKGWTSGLVKREVTAGAIHIIDGQPVQCAEGRADYLLRVQVHQDTQPVAVAVIEAKREGLSPTYGLEQAKQYAQASRLNVPFVYASNGHMFVEFDSITGRTSQPQPMAQFPTPAELHARYEAVMGFSLAEEVAKPLITPCQRGEGQRRYYQDAAIRAVFEKIAQCTKQNQPKRALLSLATGAGKTFIAVNMLRRFADAGQLTRALFVCDRDELRTQALAALRTEFGDNAAEVRRDSDGNNAARNARVHVATYQTLGVADESGDASFLTEFYPPDYFSHIVIDECHRSAWGKWSQVLTRNPNAVQIGLTATPRQFHLDEDTSEARADAQITANNIQYFGEPVYEYTLAQAQEDGYLAACEIKRGRVNIDDTGITIDEIIARNPVDVRTGQPISPDQIRKLYEATTYEDRIQLPDRVMAMCADLFNHLLDTGGPEQKTIIFCARDSHADAVAIELNNLYAKWCADNQVERKNFYAFKCTAASSGNDQLPDFKGASRSHFIATTVDLLTTGVDVPVVRNIVFFKYVKSPIAFHQMVGRGTRLAHGKLMFRVYDYTDATRLFPEDFIVDPPQERTKGRESDREKPPPEPIIRVAGFDVQVRPDGDYILTNVDGRAVPVPVEEYKQRLAAKLIAEAASLDDFRAIWIDPSRRDQLLYSLPDGGRSALLLRELDKMEAYDLYDVLARLGYHVEALTRAYRVGQFNFREASWLAGMPESGRAIVTALANQFAMAGTEAMESPDLFRTPEVIRAGGLAALRQVGEPAEILKETKRRILTP